VTEKIKAFAKSLLKAEEKKSPQLFLALSNLVLPGVPIEINYFLGGDLHQLPS
jgi:hypothetical protein